MVLIDQFYCSVNTNNLDCSVSDARFLDEGVVVVTRADSPLSSLLSSQISFFSILRSLKKSYHASDYGEVSWTNMWDFTRDI